MIEQVAQFLGILGVAPPSTMGELIPYLLTVTVGVVLVSAVFKVIATVAAELLSMRRF